MTYVVGQAIRLATGTITGNDGPNDPETLTLKILKPNGMLTVLSINDLQHVGTGKYFYDYLPTIPGVFSWEFVATSPNAAARGSFEMEPALAAPTTPADSANWVTAQQVRLRANNDNLTDSDAGAAAQIATELLQQLTGNQFGLRQRKIRPQGCGQSCDWSVLDRQVVGWGLPLATMLGPWPLPGPAGGMSWSCGGCGCGSTAGVELRGPVVWDTNHLISVLVDGEALTVGTDFIVVQDGATRLVRLNGMFPQCQDLRRATSLPGTMQVTYWSGVAVPQAGVQACISLAVEVAKEIGATGSSCLPQHVSTVNRQGVSAVVLDPLDVIKDGGTGLTDVDLFVSAFNPNKLRRGATITGPRSRSSAPTVRTAP